MVVNETVDTGRKIRTISEEQVAAALRSVNLEVG